MGSHRHCEPRIAALDVRPDPARLTEWAGAGVTDVIYGLPDRGEADVMTYLDRLAAKLSLSPST